MSKLSFSYKIGPRAFEDTILDIRNKEGGDWQTAVSIEREIAKQQAGGFYQNFMAACKSHHIEIVPILEGGDGKEAYRLEIRKDGRCWYHTYLRDRREDVTPHLAEKLYEVLGVALKNEQVIELAKGGNKE